jgi:hypothetical protein
MVKEAVAGEQQWTIPHIKPQQVTVFFARSK